ncbi:glutathione peroxidase [Alicyclobacillus contaminans]|uniref:glutathione peroxidase n=1 Tax=Alicyclobacillus contaminans TaxID=392016 RepID=UPI0004126C29|nr:glutathione peroxidase [Alicyclobacillus contaminans]GMA51501.1 glutathione peroxidase [Alicyclobacillus contaminans]
MSVYDFHVTDMDGHDISLDKYRGQVLLIVNTASQCGFTPQYEGLQSLYETYKDRGFSVLGFPCNQFGHQEPGTEAEIREFCSTRFRVTFPLFAKIDVNGKNAHPLYQYLKQSQRGVLSGAIKWNFTKFLINRQGVPVQRFAPATPPEQLIRPIEELLDAEA